ncbi:MAG: T9SS type A sorting domain-containing protein [Bacteroidetes bacterium]|nr:T9SS type A sorting domain-containing protein [Bacteroidota bacterium]
MAKYGMAIDLNRCVGCGTCGLACKTENNTDYKQGGTTFNWADFVTFTTGSYANGNFQFHVLPVLCNHCSDAPCVAVCPPHALFKNADNLTMHDESKCLGDDCGHLCIDACPFSNMDVDAEGVPYSVLQANPKNQNTLSIWDNSTSIITGCTTNPADTVTAAGNNRPPYKNAYTHQYYSAVRPSNVIEKCYFCDHRLQNGEQPYCVVSCPANARIFGDLNDPTSDISQALNTYEVHRLKNNNGEFLADGENGTDPNVYYLGKYGIPPALDVQEVIPAKAIVKLNAYPNPATNVVHIEFDLDSGSYITISLFDIAGKEVFRVIDNEHRMKGAHKIDVDVSKLKPGSYICRLQTADDATVFNFVVGK